MANRKPLWRNHLQTRDLAVVAAVFGFASIQELEDFINIQNAKSKGHNGNRFGN